MLTACCGAYTWLAGGPFTFGGASAGFGPGGGEVPRVGTANINGGGGCGVAQMSIGDAVGWEEAFDAGGRGLDTITSGTALNHLPSGLGAPVVGSIGLAGKWTY